MAGQGPSETVETSAEGTHGHTPIAELIGWEPCTSPICWLTVHEGRPHWFVPGEQGERFEHTIDDLLAWLNEKLFHVWIEVYGDPGALPEAWDVYVNYRHVIEYGVEEARHFNACAPTLLGAFEEIVRQVASL